MQRVVFVGQGLLVSEENREDYVSLQQQARPLVQSEGHEGVAVKDNTYLDASNNRVVFATYFETFNPTYGYDGKYVFEVDLGNGRETMIK
jgi:hypothetical protein